MTAQYYQDERVALRHAGALYVLRGMGDVDGVQAGYEPSGTVLDRSPAPEPPVSPQPVTAVATSASTSTPSISNARFAPGSCNPRSTLWGSHDPTFLELLDDLAHAPADVRVRPNMWAACGWCCCSCAGWRHDTYVLRMVRTDGVTCQPCRTAMKEDPWPT